MLKRASPGPGSWCLAGAIVTGLSGCASPLPTYPRLGDGESCRIIAERLEAVDTVSGEGRIMLTAPDGRTVRLEGALAADPPERLRLRAWKLGRAVLDITAVGDEVWAFAPEESAGQSFDVPEGGIARAMRLFRAEFFRGARVVEGGSTDRLLVLTETTAHDAVTCEVDRPTLTPRRFRVTRGGVDGVLVLDRYRMTSGIAWPNEWRFESERGSAVIRLDRVEINGPLPETAFVPPRRAERREP